MFYDAHPLQSSISIHMDNMSGSEDSDNDFREQSADMDADTNPEASQSSKDPGTPSSHGLPKAATRARRKLNSDEEDLDFVPEEILAKKQQEKKEKAAKKAADEATSTKRPVRKEYAGSEARRA